MNRVDRRKLEKELDTMWSVKIRSFGFCERCGKKPSLQAAHIIPRIHKNTRWDLGNGICLCWSCHFNWAHKHPTEFSYKE